MSLSFEDNNTFYDISLSPCDEYSSYVDTNPEIGEESLTYDTTVAWTGTNPNSWTPKDLMYYFTYKGNCKFGDYENINYDTIRGLNGSDFLELPKEQIIKSDPVYGNFFLECKKDIINHQILPPFGNSFDQPRIEQNSYSESESISSIPEPVTNIVKRSPGRPPKPNGTLRKKTENTTGRLWEFIRNLLLNEDYCPSLIKWENRKEGVFKFVQSDKVAELWGKRKNNKKMNYEKLSRAMRYYYKSKVLMPVAGRRLVYKFGPTSTGW